MVFLFYVTGREEEPRVLKTCLNQVYTRSSTTKGTLWGVEVGHCVQKGILMLLLSLCGTQYTLHVCKWPLRHASFSVPKSHMHTHWVCYHCIGCIFRQITIVRHQRHLDPWGGIIKFWSWDKTFFIENYINSSFETILPTWKWAVQIQKVVSRRTSCQPGRACISTTKERRLPSHFVTWM